jgi:hypothetical protein
MFLTKQIGEHLVVAELGRNGLIATPFAGNVQNFDLVILPFCNYELRTRAACHKSATFSRSSSIVPSLAITRVECFLRSSSGS